VAGADSETADAAETYPLGYFISRISPCLVLVTHREYFLLTVHQNLYGIVLIMAVTTIDDLRIQDAELRLFEVEREREAAEQQFSDADRALKDHDRYRARLVSAHACARTRFAQLHEERAGLMRVLGKIK
jgi:hypothetical protein